MFLALNKSLRTLLLITVVFTATFLMPQPSSATAVCVCYFGDVNDCEPTAVTDAAMDGECKKACEVVRGSGLKTYKYAATATDGGAIIAECSAAHATAIKEEPVQAVIPKLNVKIPTVTFSPVKNIGGVVHIKFLSDYISGVYKFLLIFSTVSAIVLLMVGGFQYVLGAGASGQIEKGKKRIKNALTGLVLLLSVVLILETINPQLTALPALRIKKIPRLEFEDKALAESETTITKTEEGGESSAVTATGDCPIALSLQPEKIGGSVEKLVAYRKEFVQKAPKISGSASERIKQAAELISKCDVFYGSCGQDSSMIYAMAGIGPTDCLLTGKLCNGNMSDNANVDQIYSVFTTKNKLRQKLPTFYCPSECSKNLKDSNPLITRWYEMVKDPAKPKAKGVKTFFGTYASGCSNSAAEAMANVKAAAAAGGAWKEDAKELLQTGDYYATYNANKDCVGMHSTIFLGWQDKAKLKAYVVDGDISHLIKIKTRDLSKSLLISIRRPKPGK